MDLSSRRISESGEQYTTAGRDFHAQSSDDERARRQSVASLGSLDDAPRDRLVALLNDIISGRHVDCSSAQEVSCSVTPRLLFRWRGGGGTLSQGGCPGGLPFLLLPLYARTRWLSFHVESAH